MTQLGLPPSHGTFTSAASVAYASSRRMPYRSRGRPAGMRVPAEAFFDFKKADNWHLNIGQIPPAAGFATLHVALAAIRDGSSELSSRCDTVQCGPVDDRNLRSG